MTNTKFLAILPITILVVAIGMYAPNNAFASSNPALTDPVTTLTCDYNVSTQLLSLTWDAYTASKFAVSIQTSYPDSLTDPNQSFSTTLPGGPDTAGGSTTIDLQSINLVDPSGVSVDVKGLTTPVHGGSGNSQNNAEASAECSISGLG
jgi:hypothetical protein